MKKIITLFLVAFVFGFAGNASAAHYITVQKGDSMWKIAKRYNVSFSQVLKLNTHFDNQHLIYPGDKILIPDGSTGTGTTQNSENDSMLPVKKPLTK